MSPFSFPNPAIQAQIVHPDTGDLWIFEDGVWMLADPNDPEGPIPDSTDDCPPATFDGDLQGIVNLLQSEIVTLRSDIIELRAQLQAASVNNFLILE